MQFRQGHTGVVKEEALAVAFCNTSLGRTPQFNNETGMRSFGYGGPRRGSSVIGPYNFCGKEGQLMRSCNELAQEMVKRAKERCSRPSLARPNYHANLLMEDPEGGRRDADIAVDLFDATLNLLEMEKETGGWVIDSGASRSVTGDSSMFQGSLERALGTVTTANGQNLSVEGAGTVDLANNGEIKMHEVLYVPRVTRNLLSVRSFCQHGYVLVFDDKQCLIIKDKDKIVGRGIVDNSGFYRFIVEDCSFPLYAIESPEITSLWHRRLGHLNNHSLRFLFANKLATGLPLIPTSNQVCGDCMIGKQSRERRVKASERCASKPFELIHSDLCGMIKPQSLGGAHYFISFTDNYIRYTWLFFMRLKFQAF
jgi:hypothetical protein